MDYNKMHIIKGDDTDVVYYGDTFMMMIGNKVVCQILEILKKGKHSVNTGFVCMLL